MEFLSVTLGTVFFCVGVVTFLKAMIRDELEKKFQLIVCGLLMGISSFLLATAYPLTSSLSRFISSFLGSY